MHHGEAQRSSHPLAIDDGEGEAATDESVIRRIEGSPRTRVFPDESEDPFHFLEEVPPEARRSLLIEGGGFHQLG